MDKKLFIKKLKTLFTDFNKSEKRYSDVWLSDIDFGGLYFSEKCILNVKMDIYISALTEEIDFLLDFLKAHLNTEDYTQIESVTIYKQNERIYHEKEDIILFDNDDYLKAA